MENMTAAYTEDPKAAPRKRTSAADVLELLDTHPRAVERALYVLYQRQEADERRDGSTRYANGVGFNAWDAAFLTDVAQYMIRNRRLTRGQRRAVRRALTKYTGQLAAIANGEA